MQASLVLASVTCSNNEQPTETDIVFLYGIASSDYTSPKEKSTIAIKQKAETSTLRFGRQRLILVFFRLLVITKWRRRKRLPPLIFFALKLAG